MNVVCFLFVLLRFALFCFVCCIFALCPPSCVAVPQFCKWTNFLAPAWAEVVVTCHWPLVLTGFVCIPCSVLYFGASSHMFILGRMFALKRRYVSSYRAWWIAIHDFPKFCCSLHHLFVFVYEMCLTWARALYLYPLACCASSGTSCCLYIVAFRLSRPFDCLAALAAAN